MTGLKNCETIFGTISCNICGSSSPTLHNVRLLGHQILMWILDFWKNLWTSRWRFQLFYRTDCSSYFHFCDLFPLRKFGNISVVCRWSKAKRGWHWLYVFV